MCVERAAASSVYLGILAFLSHCRLFNYFKVRYTEVQLAVLNKVVGTRGRLNSVLCNFSVLAEVSR